MLHLQGLHAGYLAIAALQASHHMPGFVPERAVLVEVRGIAGLDEATVARGRRKVTVESGIEFACEVEVGPAQRFADIVQAFGQPSDGGTGREPVSKMAGDHQPIPDCPEVSRASACNRNPAERPLQIRHGGKLPPDVLAQA